MEKNIISKLWILLTVNYIFCDVFSLYHSVFLNQILTGSVEGIEFTESFLLQFSIIMEIPMLMIFISMVLKNRLHKIVNISVSLLMIIIQIGSLTTGSNSKHYIFFSFVEIGVLLLIIYLVYKFKPSKT